MDGGRRQSLVRQVASPTLIFAGELDPVFPLVDARVFADGFVDGRLVVMPRTAHDFPASAIRDHSPVSWTRIPDDGS